MAGALVTHFLGSFPDDTAAAVYVASTGWTPIGGARKFTTSPGLQYYNTQTLRIRTLLPTGVWQEESRFLPPRMAAADDPTPSVKNCNVLMLDSNAAPAPAVASTIVDLDDAEDGQVITLVCMTNVNPSWIEDAGNFALSASWTPGATDTLTLVYDGHRFYESSRSNN